MSKPLLTLILAEAALERVPAELTGHPQVRRQAEKAGKPPGSLILDRSYHHQAMVGLKNGEKRGRPDIVHFCLLEALGSPLNLEGLLQVYVHTVGGFTIWVNPEVRLPRNYNRFIGLMEQLFQAGRVPPEGRPLLTLRRMSLRRLLGKLKPTFTLALTRRGKPQPVRRLGEALASTPRPTVLVGAFPHGGFTKQTLSLADEAAAIDPEGLEAWTVVSRIISAYEEAIGLPEARLKRIRQQS